MGTTPSPEPRERAGRTRPEDETTGPDTARTAAIAAGVLGGALALGALALFGTRAAFSVTVGAVIAVANLLTMNAIIRAMLRPAEEEAAALEAARKAAEKARAEGADEAAGSEEGAAPSPGPDHAAEGKRGGAAWGLFAVMKILILFGGVWILLTRGMVDPIPLVVGYGVLPLGIAASSLFTSLSPRRKS